MDTNYSAPASSNHPGAYHDYNYGPMVDVDTAEQAEAIARGYGFNYYRDNYDGYIVSF